MDTNRDALGFEVSNSNTSKATPAPTYGKGQGYIKFLRVLGYLFAIFIAVGGVAVSFSITNNFGFVVFFGAILTALVSLAGIMVYLDLAANMKATADNTAKLIDFLVETEDK